MRGGVAEHEGCHLRHVGEVHERLTALQRPGQLEHASFEDRLELEGEHVVRGLKDRELEPGGQQVLLDVALDLVLDQVGGNRV